MDWVGLKSRGIDAVKKYRYVLLILLAGVFLMALPEGKEEETTVLPQTVEETQPGLQEALADILSQIAGAGQVRVLLTQSAGEQTVYQTDETISSGENTQDIRRETVLVTDSSREETGLVRQVNPPVYQGAIVLCQGADSASIRLSIVEAVADVTGLSTDKITVLKMK